jgi:hypothetical protein
MKKRVLYTTAAVFAVTASVSTGTSGAAPPASPWTFQPVISHLNEPRGLSFDGRGDLYVAEAGHAGSATAGVTRTGAVSKFRWAGGALTRAWSTKFTSVYMPAEGGGGGSEVLGPAAVSATGNGCSRHHGDGRGHAADRSSSCQVSAILSLSHRGIKAEAGLDVPQLGHLYRLNGRTGKAKSVSDVGDRDYAWTSRHADLFTDFPDANPYAVLNLRGHDGRGARTFVADAGANTISRVSANGRTRVISYIPNETSGAMRDATPTCISQGPDGALYVGTLDLLSNFAAGSGQSNVWRVNPNSTNWRHNATLWATGYTTINGCTFDRHGNFWASELFYPNAAGPPGDLAMAPFDHPNAITHLGGGTVALPGGIAQGPDGAMYVSTGSADPTPGSGAIVRVAAH